MKLWCGLHRKTLYRFSQKVQYTYLLKILIINLFKFFSKLQ